MELSGSIELIKPRTRPVGSEDIPPGRGDRRRHDWDEICPKQEGVEVAEIILSDGEHRNSHPSETR